MRVNESLNADMPHGITAGELIELLSRVPADAKVTVNHHKGDRPFDSDWSTINATWTTTSGDDKQQGANDE